MDCSILIVSLIGYRSNEENNKKIINHFTVQSYKVDNGGYNSSRHDVSAVIRNVGKSGDYKGNRRDFLEPQYDDKRRVLKKKTQKKKNLPRNKMPRKGQYMQQPKIGEIIKIIPMIEKKVADEEIKKNP